MDLSKLPDFEIFMAESGITTNAVELSALHGLTCGLLCARPGLAIYELAEVLSKMGSTDMLESNMSAQLELLFETTRSQLHNDQYEIQIWLPDDETRLQVRTRCLGEWCSSVLAGLSELAGDYLAKIDGEASEAIKDFTEIARAAGQEIEDSESNEDDFMQISEYCRVALLLFQEALRGADDNAQLH